MSWRGGAPGAGAVPRWGLPPGRGWPRARRPDCPPPGARGSPPGRRRSAAFCRAPPSAPSPPARPARRCGPQAGRRVRGARSDPTELPDLQLGLIRGLEALGAPGAAYQVAATALAELDTLPDPSRKERQDLLMAAPRLANTRPGGSNGDDPLVAAAGALAPPRRPPGRPAGPP